VQRTGLASCSANQSIIFSAVELVIISHGFGNRPCSSCSRHHVPLKKCSPAVLLCTRWGAAGRPLHLLLSRTLVFPLWRHLVRCIHAAHFPTATQQPALQPHSMPHVTPNNQSGLYASQVDAQARCGKSCTPHPRYTPAGLRKIPKFITASSTVSKASSTRGKKAHPTGKCRFWNPAQVRTLIAQLDELQPSSRAASTRRRQLHTPST
jgi:hypothetical protein